MVKLFGTSHCPNCEETKRTLKEFGIKYKEYSSIDNEGLMYQACLDRDIDPKQIKTNPVMITEDMVYTGADCSEVIKEGLVTA